MSLGSLDTTLATPSTATHAAPKYIFSQGRVLNAPFAELYAAVTPAFT